MFKNFIKNREVDLTDYRKSFIEERLKFATFTPLDIMVTGVTGAGKSTTLNSLFEKEIAKVGDSVDPETMNIDSYSLNNSIRLWDTPGLGDGIGKDKTHSKKIIDLLYKSYGNNNSNGWVDLVLVIIDGSNRDMGSTYKLLNDIIVPNFPKDKILVAINQADMAMKGRNWNSTLNCPETKLLDFLEQKSLSIKNRVKEATNVDIIKPIYYSGEYGYNIKQLYDIIIDNIPCQRRELVA